MNGGLGPDHDLAFTRRSDLEAEQIRPDANLVLLVQLDAALERSAVEKSAVAAFEVFKQVRVAIVIDAGVAAADLARVEQHIHVRLPAEDQFPAFQWVLRLQEFTLYDNQLRHLLRTRVRNVWNTNLTCRAARFQC